MMLLFSVVEFISYHKGVVYYEVIELIFWLR